MDAVDLDAWTVRVLAPNPSPTTLEGTNTYLVGSPGSGELVCVDPGPDLAEHRDAVERAAGARDAAIVAVVLTHHHGDHAEAAGWADRWGAALLAGDPALITAAPAEPLGDGQRVDRAGAQLEAVATPGHASDHLCLRVRESGAVLSGDHVLGRGTTVVAWPDGDMAAYRASLERLARIDAPVLYPGHGPVVDRPREVVAQYLAHRRERESQVLEALRAGVTTPSGIVARLYTEVDPRLHPLAERSVRAHLAQLEAEGRVSATGDRYAPTKITG